MTVKDLFIHLRADQIIYFETLDGHYLEHGPAARIYQRFADCPIGTISCNNPYKSMFVSIMNPEGKEVFKVAEDSIW